MTCIEIINLIHSIRFLIIFLQKISLIATLNFINIVINDESELKFLIKIKEWTILNFLCWKGLCWRARHKSTTLINTFFSCVQSYTICSLCNLFISHILFCVFVIILLILLCSVHLKRYTFSYSMLFPLNHFNSSCGKKKPLNSHKMVSYSIFTLNAWNKIKSSFFLSPFFTLEGI